jgi:hypothetical protein
MEINRIFLFLTTIFLLHISCHTSQKTASVQTETPNTQQTISPGNAELAPLIVDTDFDPKTISKAQYDSTLEEVQHFIEELNLIINNRNYSSWRSALSQEYFNEISSPEYLNYISEQPAMKTRNIILKTPQDYFNNVVVPSRANSRVDEIEFESRNRVKVYTVTTRRQGDEQNLRLYDLEKIGNSWKIIN